MLHSSSSFDNGLKYVEIMSEILTNILVKVKQGKGKGKGKRGFV